MDVVNGLIMMAMYFGTAIIALVTLYVVADYCVRTVQYMHANDVYRTRTHHKGMR